MVRLSGYEQETIINFNKEEKMAWIFTYDKTWQKHLEDKLGLKPIMDNGFGGKEYQIDKKRITMPRTPRKLSQEHKMKSSLGLEKARQKRVLSFKTMSTDRKSGDKHRV
jgi:hypothetical protein